MTDAINVVIIEDHALMREGIKAIISRDEKIKVIGESDNVDDGYDVVMNCNPDILLLDIALHGSSGLVLAKRLLAAKPDLLIIIITAYSKIDYILEAVESGVKGYILKESSPENLADAIEKVYAGEIYIDSYISNKVIKSLITKNDVEIAEDNKSAYSKLSLREQQILKLLIDGVPIKDIAEELFISSKTVENHKASIMVKLKCKNMTELIRYAISIGLIDV
ncbi:MAG: response regulator transcription factor [Spirochaetia bacterium]|jgi:DNA-binding NarL/FixJ family response regulator|nr:response regulator transcription factor [Spirochaetia bacterium]MBR4437164.1 response regulator transcription factor [Spirochaetales bacterium]MBR4797490.1 response regulator transcription factor [Spirochaetia bacterium]MBR5016726.1 response regulator transcription factor [Spirochaetia bacterium]MBR5915852.1 response regulator transcription factor [Spirochaetia bacterium]